MKRVGLVASLGAFLGFGLLLPALADAPVYSDKSKLLVYRDAEGKKHPIRNAVDWARRREHILANVQRVMGPLPADVRQVVYEWMDRWLKGK